MATYPVKWLHSQMRGAPVLSGTVGSLVGLLDACLIDGFGTDAVTSIVVSGGVATVTVSSGLPFEEGRVILVAGATPAALNGEQRVTSAGATTSTFATGAPDGSATGSITVKYAPVGGWEKAFSASNKAVYRSLSGPRRFLRVDDSAAQYARVVGYNDMTDVDTGTGPFPTAAQMSGGLYWPKASGAGSAAQRYDVFADGLAVIYAPSIAYATYGSTYNQGTPFFFGLPLAVNPAGDAWCTTIIGQTGSYWADSTGFVGTHKTNGTYVERALVGTGGAIKAFTTSAAWALGVSGNEPSQGAFPSAVDGKMRVSRVRVTLSDTDDTPRANLPGVFWINNTGAHDNAGLVPRDTLYGPGGSSAGKLMYFRLGGTSKSGAVLFEVDGPWR